MHLNPSVQRYVNDPGHYHLQMQGDTLHAVEGKVNAIGHEILFPQLQQLKALTNEPLAQKVLTVIRSEQLEVKSEEPQNEVSLFSRIWTTIGSLFGASSLTDLETNLHEWCEKKIGTPEYANRIKAAKRIQECYLKKETTLPLNGLGLTTLPSSIGNLTALQTFNCNGNRLTTLPNSIGNLTALQTLNCSGNHLTALPESIGSLTALQTLDCQVNRLTTLPNSIGNLTALQTLNCNDNSLTTLPNSIGNLTILQTLRCYNNQLTTLSDSIGNLTALQTLNCFNNQITTLPGSIGNLTALQTFSCYSNHLTTLPDSIGKLTALQTLYCYRNQLTTLPDSIGNLTALQTLTCNNNQLTTLPNSIGNLTALQTLTCHDNHLTILPDSIGNLRTLKELWCHNNQLTTLPSALARLSNSCRGSFEDNRLTPASIQLFQEAVTAERLLHPAHGPVFDFSIHDSNSLQEGVSPKESLIFWLTAFQKAFPRAAHETMWISRRERFPPEEAAARAGASSFLNFYAPLLSHPEKDNLRTFLFKLQGTDAYKNPRTQNNMIFRLEQILTSACEDPDFRVQFFLIIRDAVATCGDRTAWGFNELDTYWRLHCEVKNLDDLSVAKLLIGKARIEHLKQIAAQDVEARRANPSTTTGIDEIEVFLYYQVKLKAALHLPISSEGMLYPAMSDVTEGKLLAASKKVKDETSKPEQIAALLAASEEMAANLWEGRMQKAYPARFDAINGEIMERVASMPEELSDAERQSQMKNLQEEQKARTRQLIRKLSLEWVSEHWNELGL